MKSISAARNTPLLPNSLAPLTDPLPGLSWAKLQDLVDLVLSYGFPTFYNKPLVRLPIIAKPLRNICIGLEAGGEIGIFVGDISGIKHERIFANAAMFWEWSWSVAEVLETARKVDKKMRELGFYDSYEGRRLNLFEANLPIPVEHVFPGPHAFYDLTPQTDSQELADRFDDPEAIQVLVSENRRVICHKDYAAAIATIFDSSKALYTNRIPVHNSSLNN
ncbi:hypothetical protein KKG46_04980 [Patescibacteria group bacterium]|nr:hypothetical protein [Patescibacteria group bacterium]